MPSMRLSSLKFDEYLYYSSVLVPGTGMVAVKVVPSLFLSMDRDRPAKVIKALAHIQEAD